MTKDIKDRPEKWLPVTGFEKMYEVSNNGFVRNVKTNTLKTRRICKKGYYEVGLCKNGKTHTLRVHRLVGKAHVPNPHNLPILNHEDGNKLNCADWNLKWSTQSYNCKHAYDIGLSNKMSEKRILTLTKMNINRSKKVIVTDIFTGNEVRLDSIKAASQMIGISHSAVSHGIKYKRVLLDNYKVKLAIDKTKFEK